MQNRDKIQFFDLVNHHSPLIIKYWNREKTDLDINALDTYMKSCSTGERVLAKFFGGIWCGDNRFDFDLIAATKVLGREQLIMVAKWSANPIFP